MHFFLQFISPGNIQKWPFKSDVLTTNSLLFPELPIYLSPFSRYTILLPEIALMFSRSIFLFSILFSLRALCWPTYDAFLKTLKRPHGVWFFCLFYSNFSINFNLENVVTEYLKWLKMGENFNQDISWIQAFVLSRHCFDQDISLIQIWFSISTARKAKCVCIQHCLSSRIPDIFEWRWI